MKGSKYKVKMSRRAFLRQTGIATGAVALSSIINACTPKATPTPSTVPGEVALPDAVAPLAASGNLDVQTLDVGYYAGPGADAHIRIGPRFEDYTQGKVSVAVENIDRQTFDAKMTTAMQSGEEIWDVMVGLNLTMRQMVEAGWLEPLDDYLADPRLLNAELYNYEDFPESIRELLSYNGKTYMIAQAPSVPMLMYRKDILEKYGVAEPPEDGWSWDELRENATTVHAGLQADGETDVYGLLFGGKPSAAALIPMMAIWSYGQELFDENFNPLFDSPKAIEAVQFIYDLVHKDQIVSPGMPGYEYPEILVALQEGKAAIAIQWDSAVQTLNDPEASPLTGGNMGYSFFPWEKSVGPDHARIFPAIDGLVIPTSSTQKEAAFEYIAWFTSKENGKDMLINGGGNSGRASLLTDPDVLAKHSSYPAEAKTAALYHQLPDLASLLFIVFGILNPNWNGMFSGQTTPEEANKKINEEIIAHLKEEGVLS